MYKIEKEGRVVKIEFPADWSDDYIEVSIQKIKEAVFEDAWREARRVNSASSEED